MHWCIYNTEISIITLIPVWVLVTILCIQALSFCNFWKKCTCIEAIAIYFKSYNISRIAALCISYTLLKLTKNNMCTTPMKWRTSTISNPQLSHPTFLSARALCIQLERDNGLHRGCSHSIWTDKGAESEGGGEDGGGV